MVAEKKAGAKPYGVDFSYDLVLKAKRRGINTICCNLNDYMPFKDGCFDVIIANQIIEHLTNPTYL
ncbi:hypothetical protein DRP05_10295 [Archaeoglobales archaeon]|nr:MAG: hypothetical protein DRP05_10295 [Archaeoglobales archaeon]